MSGTLTFGGDKMLLQEHADGSATITFDDVGTGRVCGGCTTCCKLIPVPTLGKPAGVRCKHSRAGKGCSIYSKRPTDCRSWSCRWMADRETAGMPRPDRCHYVIDLAYDYVTQQRNDGGEPVKISVIQVWVDPAFRAASRAPELLEYMDRMATKYRVATIIRFDSRDGYVVFPPALSSDGEWHEVGGEVEVRTLEQRNSMNKFTVTGVE